MLDFPNKFDFGKEIAKAIDRFFKWINLTFKGLFNFLRSLINSSITIVNELLTKTPWWLWVGIFVVGIVFTILKKKKIKWISIFSIILLWLVLYNVYFKNPIHGFDLNKFQTPWFVYAILLFIGSLKLYNYKVASILTALLLLIGIFGVWNEMVLTLSIIIIAVFISFILGIPLGIWMSKSQMVENIFRPILDLLQTIPTFVYLIPAVMLFGIGVVPGTVATIIYALPPVTRLTFLGIKEVDEEMVEAGKAFGSTKMQLLLKVELPQALTTIATGLNQTTMMAVAMVVTASMIGAGGLGAIVFDATQQNKIGVGFVGGFAIVALAIILDRMLQGVANKIEMSRGDIQ